MVVDKSVLSIKPVEEDREHHTHSGSYEDCPYYHDIRQTKEIKEKQRLARSMSQNYTSTSG